MNVGKMLLAAVVGGVVYFLLGWLVYGTLLASVFEPAAEMKAVIARPQEEFKLGSMLVSCLAWGGLLSYIFARWAGIRTFTSGATAGAIIGALVSLCVNTSMYAMYTFVTTTQIGADLVMSAVISAITGGVIGWMLGRGENS